MKELYADIAVPLAVERTFTYSIPGELTEIAKPGVRVIVPFGKRSVTGIIISTSNVAPSIPAIKKIHDILDSEPLIPPDLINITRWISEYYFTSIGEVIKTILIRGAFKVEKRMVTFIGEDLDKILENLSSAPKQQVLLKETAKYHQLSVTQLQKRLHIHNIYSILNELTRKGWINIKEVRPGSVLKPKFENVIETMIEDKNAMQKFLTDVGSAKPAKRLESQIFAVKELLNNRDKETGVTNFLKKTGVSLSTLNSLTKKQVIKITKREVIRKADYDLYSSSLGSQNIIPNKDQQGALEKIAEGFQNKTFKVFLLHGVTGSGKTQVYIEATRTVLKEGKTAIVLVPEISLTPQIVRRFKFHFGDKVAVFHSRMSQGERYDTWRLAKDGRVSVVIGPRSAVFAPLQNLGIIVVDEEQEASYKQYDQTPRFNARDVAIIRGRESNAIVVLGSATPSIESYYNVLTGKYLLLELPERVDNATLPTIQVVDMSGEKQKKLLAFRKERSAAFKADRTAAKLKKYKFEFGSISELLKEKIENRLIKKEGIILLQNRRGFAPFVECLDCGHVEICDNCNITLTYHIAKKHMRCHYCGFVKQLLTLCPECKSTEIEYHGFGTQRIESELTKLFPEAKILRMDLDTTSARGSHDEILRKFSDGKADILLGTQMVAKGLDFSRVTLVGVVSADTQMLLPDFRSSERTYQLLTQVAGRAGRSNLAGEVIIQTYQPDHFCLKHVITHNFKEFYQEEIGYRKELLYPPFSRLIMIEFRGKRENDVMEQAETFSRLLKNTAKNFIVLGPAAAVLTKLKKDFRWHIVIKSPKEEDPGSQQIHKVLKEVLQKYKNSSGGRDKGVRIIIDVDPIGML